MQGQKDSNLSRLAQEPIHLYNRIQPYGIVLVLEEPSLKVIQISNNAPSMLGMSIDDLIENNLDEIFDSFQIEKIKEGLENDNFDGVNPTKLWARVKGDDYLVFDATFHRNLEGLLILELEPALSYESIPFLSFYHLAKTSISKLGRSASLTDYCQIIVQEVRKLTGFDRVMLYRFDEQNHGHVIAEDKIPELEPYLGLHYPESDIPAPARRLLSSNWIRIIADARSGPVDMIPQKETSLDLTFSTLRSPSPCHLEYLHNMGVGASLTISLLKDNQLWGIIACHHQTPKYVPYELRKACEFLGRVVFSEISSREETEDYDYRMRLAYINSALIDRMAVEENFVDGLIKPDLNILYLANAGGAAICFGGNYTTLGKTPNEDELNHLVHWLQNNVREEVFSTNSLAHIYADAQQYKDVASGLLVIPISKRNYVLWFRPEVIQTVNWGGDPNKAYDLKHHDGDYQMCPRKSFQLWKETVKLKSLPWKTVEINAALELRKAMINIVLRQADELAQLAQDLERSNAELKKFAYVASHDLQEPLNQVANYVQLLEMRYREALDEDASEFINFAVEGVSLMQNLIDDVLAYSKVDMQGNELILTETGSALDKALANLRGRILETGAVITHDALPTIMAEKTQLMQLFQNLIGNAIKFRSNNPPQIHIGVERLEEEWLFSVKDNGIGIDPRYSDRIFIIFQRLHTRDEYQGTGMGLAICKKIIECHRGRLWVESELEQGATFYFTIPVGGRSRGFRSGLTAQNYLASRRQ
ncbi:MAG: Phytochrome-like protein cph1 [Chroococcopsis gigantea SAG 12.99]|jgi:chemotaxis family two-component system sensor kinase Cph1|nr:GAF domain-containing protein [Chlorogloea purpurea SAG 13.99]MDV2999127.1 Phytochrome-like protein cph1 [Chroococcopsis gigantea SAG 12.99]